MYDYAQKVSFTFLLHFVMMTTTTTSMYLWCWYGAVAVGILSITITFTTKQSMLTLLRRHSCSQQQPML